MKRISFFLMSVLSLGLFLACQKDEVSEEASEMVFVKSSSLELSSICNPVSYSLVTNNGQVGYLELSNNETSIHVKYQANASMRISEVQLWVGVNKYDVPMNRNKVPIPGKFTYKVSEKKNYEFNIELASIYHIPEILLEGKPIYVFAHASLVNKESGKVESAWSEGYTFGTNRWGTYSVFSCCHPAGGAGCFTHKAFGGMKINKDFYYDNIKKGKQNISADVGEIIGSVENDNGNLKFYFNQDWMFTDLITPEIIITGYYNPDEEGHEIYSGPPLSPKPPVYYYYGQISPYNYYKIELQVQYCATRNYSW